MHSDIRFALYAIKKNIQSSAELRSSFWLNIVGMAINNCSFVIIWSFFTKSVGAINGWSVADIIGLNGFIALTFGIIFSVGAGIRSLPEYVAGGTFDRFMLSPKNLLVRIATANFGTAAIGDIIFGLICLIFFGILINATMLQIALIFALAIIATIAFLAATIVIFSSSFLFTDATSATPSIFDLYITPSMFHGGAFQGVLRFFYTFIIPSLVIGTLPVEAVRDLDWTKMALIVITTLIWFWLSLRIFKRAVRKYESANFVNFNSN